MTKPADLAELKANAAAMAGRLKIMSHPERLIMLCRMDEGEASVTELVALSGLSQSAVSQHLALLREEGIVASRGEAQTRYYSLKDPVVRAIIHALCDICAETGG
ncbi:MAG TPA: metalloregulator ArsR/SmtB family transcription factor, partial [Novosphingobium sp.]|nr:metalloregulator ArsR/SmtB family transcription factor [Novosphingobium sp.]